MYIDNLLGKPHALEMLGTKINLSDINLPTFSVAAKNDHISLWQSVYDGVKLLRGNRTFCLTDGGHVAGIVNPTANDKYSHMISNNITESPDKWLKEATLQRGSWWNSWNRWLIPLSGKLTKSMNYNSMPMIEAAPGSYVKQ